MPCAISNGGTGDSLSESLQRFWDVEEMPSPKSVLSPGELRCEKQFVDTHTRDSTGRYVVRLPLQSSPKGTGPSTRRMAIFSLSNTHRRFARDPLLAQNF